jgi:hypothetical protein
MASMYNRPPPVKKAAAQRTPRTSVARNSAPPPRSPAFTAAANAVAAGQFPRQQPGRGGYSGPVSRIPATSGQVKPRPGLQGWLPKWSIDATKLPKIKAVKTQSGSFWK